MHRRHAIGLHQDAPEEQNAGDQPDPEAQPRVAGELRRGGPKDSAQRVHTRTRNVIRSRSSPRTGSARTWSNSGSASRERT